ncbi:hypothetical protein GJ744_008565 [Endocarpon pusillum]|uniref:Uncharacterized protein n=1 Tax=Endocarpon pusillum TaxID=364733 RepID=A0A8H7E6P5_9EURO|nr:hypothetical protein GJ744_008565 [Endocarpon pusillum]
MFAKICRKLAGKKLSKTKQAGKDPQQVEVTIRTKKSVGFENDAKLVQTIKVPRRSSSLPKADKPATGKPPVLRKEKHPSHLGVNEQQPSCRVGLAMSPIAEGGSSFPVPSRAPPASLPDARIPGCDHQMACPTSPFHGLGPLIPGTTIVNTSVISTDEAGNSTLRCRTTCMLLDGTSKTQTRDPVFIPASADNATPAEGAPSFNDSSLGESSSVAETANPQTQPIPLQTLTRPFYRQPWSKKASVASNRPVYSVPPILPRRRTIVRKPNFCDLGPPPSRPSMAM